MKKLYYVLLPLIVIKAFYDTIKMLFDDQYFENEKNGFAEYCELINF
jgi:hypothetical protein